MHAHAAETLLPYLNPGSAVLDVGSGSGYLTRVLAELVRPGGKVVGVDHVGALVDMAVGNVLKEQRAEGDGHETGKALLESGQIKFIKGDGRRGCEAEAPFDAIHVGAAASELHGELVGQLKRPGRCVLSFYFAFWEVKIRLEKLAFFFYFYYLIFHFHFQGSVLIWMLGKNSRLFVPVEDAATGQQNIFVVDKKEDGSIEKKRLFGVMYVPLTDAPAGG